MGSEMCIRDSFYYIDYTLALCCALQFWVKAAQDKEKTMAEYIELCRLGGQAPFQQLVKAANLVSPFQAGSLSAVVKQAQEYLQL